jgi:RHS repeat-associated protein
VSPRRLSVDAPARESKCERRSWSRRRRSRTYSGRAAVLGVGRYYDPATGQFLTRDPLDATTRSAYGYVADNPLNAVDPLGLCGPLPAGTVGPAFPCPAGPLTAQQAADVGEPYSYYQQQAAANYNANESLFTTQCQYANYLYTQGQDQQQADTQQRFDFPSMTAGHFPPPKPASGGSGWSIGRVVGDIAQAGVDVVGCVTWGAAGAAGGTVLGGLAGGAVGGPPGGAVGAEVGEDAGGVGGCAAGAAWAQSTFSP